MIVIGHRGAMGYRPENTLASFQKALDLGVDMIELDVHACESGELVVAHSQSISNKGIRKKIKDLSLDELKNINQDMPRLIEVLNLVNRKVKINIELKGINTAYPIKWIIDYYVWSKGWTYEDFLVSSKDFQRLKLFREANPYTRMGVIIGYLYFDPISLAKEINAWSVHVYLRHASKKLVNRCHENGLKILVWTVDSPKDIKRIKSMGVDGIFSNFPDRIRSA